MILSVGDWVLNRAVEDCERWFRMGFGTGYSSLGLLPKLPVDLLKIDKSFVGGLPDDAASVALVETVLRLASAFKLITVVEGIETMPQLQAVRVMRCDLWQGYLHSKPMPASVLEQRLMMG